MLLYLPRSTSIVFLIFGLMSYQVLSSSSYLHHFSMKHTEKVTYIPPTPQFEFLDRQSRHGIRSSLLRSLISSTNLNTHCNMCYLRPATLSEALLAHSSYYLSILHASSSPCDAFPEHSDLEHIQLTQDLLEQVGLVDDCAPFPGVWPLAMLTVGGSVLATSAIIRNQATIACWFDGGRHHAAADSAHGFCYLNDAVVACKLLLSSSRFAKVIYIDIDVHHGDGVEQAFLYNNSVTTLSFHLSELGFFPNTRPTLFPTQKHTYTDAIRVPLRRGISDDAYIKIFKEVTDVAFHMKQPDVIVLQCGADGLAGDPLGGFNLTHVAYVKAVEHVLGKHLPTVVLGGGGYTPANAARVWTDVLECCVAWTARERGDQYVPSSRDIPLTDEFFDLYSPSFRRDIKSLQMNDENNPNKLHAMVEKIRLELSDNAAG